MDCPICDNKKVKKIYIAGTNSEQGKVVACNKCSKKEEDKET